ncbi:DUF1614 domain-containing protein [Patescibacteria group bacterium]|nr:DUF1614 domain-containing protein [Patescibacteria group bacterium]
MSVLFLFLLFLIALPFVFILGFFHIVSLSFERLGLSPEVAVAVLFLMLVGSLINLPLGRRKLIEVEQPALFGLFQRKSRLVAQGLSINVGGAMIPIALAVYFLSFVPLQPTLVVTFLMVIISYRLARFVPGRGVVIPALFPAILSAIFAFVAAPDFAGPVAFVAGVFGVLIGADLLNLPKIQRETAGIMSIGGAGVFDGIFFIAIVAALLAGLAP